MKNVNVRHLEVGVKRKLARYGRNDTYAGLRRFFESFNKVLKYSASMLYREKEMLEVYQKSTFVAIDTNIRKFSAIFLSVVFKENAYYWENENKFFLHIILNRCWNLKDFRDQASDKSAPHNL